jgi:hypothetical protein
MNSLQISMSLNWRPEFSYLCSRLDDMILSCFYASMVFQYFLSNEQNFTVLFFVYFSMVQKGACLSNIVVHCRKLC